MTTAIATRAATQTAAPTTSNQPVTRDQETLNEIANLIERSYSAFSEIYENGDFERFPWLENQLAMMEEMADHYSPEKLHAWLSSLYKRYRSAKRGEAAQSAH